MDIHEIRKRIDELDEDLDNTNPRERRGDGGHPVNPPDGEGDQPGPGEDAWFVACPQPRLCPISWVCVCPWLTARIEQVV